MSKWDWIAIIVACVFMVFGFAELYKGNINIMLLWFAAALTIITFAVAMK